ncbi:MAG: peptidylprolyl isomerase [Clostridia bacterium]|nr:peptidylprolyl isomerase [Clostridia bacterium]
MIGEIDVENENIRENENLNEEVTENIVETEEIVEVADEDMENLETDQAEDSEETEDLIGDEWNEATVDVPVIEEEPINEIELAASRKRKNTIIAICAALAVVIALVAYWVCRIEGIGTKTIVSQPMIEEQKKDALKDNIRFENPVMAMVNNFTDKKDAPMTIDGIAVNKDVFQYTINSAIKNCVMSLMQTGLISDISDFDINAKAFDTDLTYLEYAKGMATESLIPIYGFIAAGEKKGITCTEEDEKKATEWLASLKGQYGDEFGEALRRNGYSSEEELLNIQRIQLLSDKVYTDIQENMDKYISKESLASAQTEEKVTVKHILIAFDEGATGDVTDAKKADALAEAKEVLEKLKAGGDFDKLMEEHNDDPGETSEGYTFADDGTMVKQFTDASFALQVGETSDLVETSYGYHIIRRLERKYSLEDYANYIRENSDVQIRKGNFSDLGITIDLQELYGAKG